jgi:hypothetical protein
VKSRDTFRHDAQTPFDDAELAALLEECSARNVTRPSSFGDLFHQRNFAPRMRAGHRKLFPTIPGGWAGTRFDPIYRGHLYQYDIRSAYLWALSLGLPDPATFRRVRRVDGPGLYWAPSPAYPYLPYPWNKPGMYPATIEEIEALPISWREIKYGVAFTPDTFDTSPWVADIMGWREWKKVGRSYWGRWAATGSVLAQTTNYEGEVNTERELPDPSRNPIWAAIITSRLRLRLWWLVDSGERKVFRVVTDSIVTDTPLDTGENVGDWKLAKEFPKGGIIHVSGVSLLTN